MKVEITKERTIITFTHTNLLHYGFVRIMPDAYILVNGKGKKGDTRTFKLYFSTIPKKTKFFDMIEIEKADEYLHPDSSAGFNFTKIWLAPLA